jgi:hypothetical protein
MIFGCRSAEARERRVRIAMDSAVDLLKRKTGGGHKAISARDE